MLYPLTGLATLAAVLVGFVAALGVARARGKYNVKAPAVTGDPGFERAFRAQQNTLEWTAMHLPALWLFALSWSDFWAGILGLMWAAARMGYVIAYGAEAKKRSPYFLAQFACFAVLWIGALIGIVRTML